MVITEPNTAKTMPADLVRGVLLLLSAAIAAAGVVLFYRSVAPDGFSQLDQFRTVLVLISVFWLAWGTSCGLLGLFHKPRERKPNTGNTVQHGKTVVLVPVYNEDPVATFSRIAAMNASLAELGAEAHFHFAVLSDTKSPEIAAQEAFWFQRLIWEQAGAGRMFYRLRSDNIGKKAGNIEDFVRRSGAAYEYAVILDADSLIEGSALVEMVRRMDADPQLGLLQTLPQVVHAQSLFGRVMQFAASYYSPVFAGGLQLIQGQEGPFWGHNAIVRVRAFAACCGLPVLSGKAPSGGHILSHDYVEAALLSRAGWTVRLDTDIAGSYEEGPENLIEFAKRDRRWCQGNLQHRRILLAPGLRWWNRFNFLQGIMAYMTSPIWFAFLAASLLTAAWPSARFVSSYAAADANLSGWVLVFAIFTLLILPKLLIVLHGVVTGTNKRFGGTGQVLLSVLLEIVFSSLAAPIMLMFQCRSVLQVLFGTDGGWPSTCRNQSQLSLRQAWTASSWIVLVGLSALLLMAMAAPASLWWIVPAVVPMLLAPVLIAISSHSGVTAERGFFATSAELQPSPVMLERERVLRRWTIGVGTEFTPLTMALELQPRFQG